MNLLKYDTMKGKFKPKSNKIKTETFHKVKVKDNCKKYKDMINTQGIPPSMEIWQTLTVKQKKTDLIPDKKKEITNI